MPEKLSVNLPQIKVLVSGHLPPPIGGMATYYQTLLGSSLPQKVDLHFVQTSSHKRDFARSGRASWTNLIAAVQDCARFTRAVGSIRPQIAHIGTAFGFSFIKHSYCVLAARLFGCQVLLHPHCSLLVLYTNRSKIWQWYFRQVIRQAHGVVALSQEWLQLSKIVPGCQVYYLPNSVDIKIYQPALENHLSETEKAAGKRILYLGYVGKAKGSFDLLDAAALIRARGIEMTFDLVGSELTSGELGLLQEKVRDLNLEGFVRLNAPAFDAQKLAFFQNADIFVYPSYHEGIPMAVLEAMASGLPVVASGVGGLPDIVKDGINGILVEPGQPDQLASALCCLADQHELRRSMQKMSFQFVTDKFSLEQHVAQLVSIYQQVGQK